MLVQTRERIYQGMETSHGGRREPRGARPVWGNSCTNGSFQRADQGLGNSPCQSRDRIIVVGLFYARAGAVGASSRLSATYCCRMRLGDGAVAVWMAVRWLGFGLVQCGGEGTHGEDRSEFRRHVYRYHECIAKREGAGPSGPTRAESCSASWCCQPRRAWRQ